MNADRPPSADGCRAKESARERSRSAGSRSAGSSPDRRRRRRDDSRHGHGDFYRPRREDRYDESRNRYGEGRGRYDESRSRYDDGRYRERRDRSPDRDSSRARTRDLEPDRRHEQHDDRRRDPRGRYNDRRRSPGTRDDGWRQSLGARYHDNRASPLEREASPRERYDGRGTSPRHERVQGEDLPPKEKPNYGLSGKLAAERNMERGVVLKYHEPSEARKPDSRWILYVYENGTPLEALHIYRHTACLIGREKLVADILIDDVSCSKQHAVIQFREISTRDELTGKMDVQVRPYILDLESTNSTYLNDDEIEPARYYQLRLNDVLQFGHSNREYILLIDPDEK